jgi:hypothetical protein
MRDELCNREGRLAAERDVARGRLIIRHYGSYDAWVVYWKSILEYTYGVILHSDGPTPLPKQIEYNCGYNQVSEAAIQARFGSQILEDSQREAKRMHADGVLPLLPLVRPPYVSENPEMEARVNEHGCVWCPTCGKGFRITSPSLWDGRVHLRCGQRLRLVQCELDDR